MYEQRVQRDVQADLSSMLDTIQARNVSVSGTQPEREKKFNDDLLRECLAQFATVGALHETVKSSQVQIGNISSKTSVDMGSPSDATTY